jgi:protein-S-isoprenylcysteine O-methyltransferase Ste14
VQPQPQLLFTGAALLCHSAPLALLFLLVCGAHYTHRVSLEEQLLMSAFGEQYAAYQRATPHRFLPGIV